MEKFIKFLKEAPTAYQAVLFAKEELEKEGFKEVTIGCKSLKKGDKGFIIKNDGTILAFKIGQTINNPSIQIVASHTDSPMLKIKPNGVVYTSGYTKINSEVYGGLIYSSFLDRPLGIAGRVFGYENDTIIKKMVNLKTTVVIPNVAIHMNREINNGMAYNPQIDLQAILSLNNVDLKELLEKEYNLKNVIDYDLFLYNKEEPVFAGSQKELLCAPRLDNLECFYVSLQAFINAANNENINIWVGFNHEEVGSSSNQGAASPFLRDFIDRIITSLSLDDQKDRIYQNTMLISADNAHAVHPNHPEKSDVNNGVYMNNGVVIKYNASLNYTTDSMSASIFKLLCSQEKVPFQLYANRSDIRGGGTLGSILLRSVSAICIDIGLAQLAMHSAFETAGVKDLEMMEKVLRGFYKRHLNVISNNKITLD